MFKVNNKRHQNDVWHRSGVFIVNFEQVNADWEGWMNSQVMEKNGFITIKCSL